MKVKCIINNCPNYISDKIDKNKNSPSFHNVPRSNSTYYKQWFQVLGGNSSFTRPKSCLVICSNHFKDEDFVTMGIKRNLKKDAIPSIDLDIGLTNEEPSTSKRKIDLSTSDSISGYSSASSTTAEVVSKKAKFDAENKKQYLDQFLGFVGEFQNKLTQPIKKKTQKKRIVTVKETDQKPPSREPVKVDQTYNVSDSNSAAEEVEEDITETIEPEIEYLVDLINEEDEEKNEEDEEKEEFEEIEEIDDIEDIEDEDPEHFSENDLLIKLNKKINRLETFIGTIFDEIKLIRSDIKENTKQLQLQNEQAATSQSHVLNKIKFPIEIASDFIKFNKICEENESMRRYVQDRFNSCKETDCRRFIRLNLQNTVTDKCRKALNWIEEDGFSVQECMIIHLLIDCTISNFRTASESDVINIIKSHFINV